MASIFTKIINREIPAEIVYEDDKVIAFRDIAPQAPVHIVIATKAERARLSDFEDEGDHQGLLNAAKKIAAAEGLTAGYRVVVNQGEYGGQTVDHLHAHLLGGRQLGWPPG
ncbi:MAG TPA: histidine triad nucleotide-binding protein [Fimbriimonadaceae bacterium]|nr:histidine triad nucleotide-binding protein [Fimbriimonadaceae bacterium]